MNFSYIFVTKTMDILSMDLNILKLQNSLFKPRFAFISDILLTFLFTMGPTGIANYK